MKKTAKISVITKKGFELLIARIKDKPYSKYACYCAGFKQGGK